MEDENMVVSLRKSIPVPQPRPSSDRPIRRGTRRRKQVRFVMAGVVGVALVAGAWYALSLHASHGTAAVSQSSATSTASNSQAAAQTADIIAKVGKLIDLPSGETPTVATVTDPSKLQGQSFFVDAKAGDIVLLYTVAREAYLYDPARNKLVEVAPITTDATQ